MQYTLFVEIFVYLQGLSNNYPYLNRATIQEHLIDKANLPEPKVEEKKKETENEDGEEG